jgi:hypothetical protein
MFKSCNSQQIIIWLPQAFIFHAVSVYPAYPAYLVILSFNNIYLDLPKI